MSMYAANNLVDLIHGAIEIETTARGFRPHRLPAWVRRQFPDPQLLMMEAQPSGVRLCFATEARVIELEVHASRVGYRDAVRARGAIDLFINGAFQARKVLDAGDLIEVNLADGSTEFRPGTSDVIRFEQLVAGPKQVEIWLPHNESIELLGLVSDAPLLLATENRPRWIHHGSSISHGSNASGPSEIWPVVAARQAEVELQYLGLGGSALLDPFIARMIRDSSSDLISIKMGINIVNLDSMPLRTFVPAVHGFLDTIRDGQPDTPLVLISPIFCPIHEDTPGPCAIDTSTLGTDSVKFIATGDPADQVRGKLTLKVIRRELAAIVANREDPNLHYLDGTTLYGEVDAQDLPLPDALHPDTRTHTLIGLRFADYAFGAGGPFQA